MIISLLANVSNGDQFLFRSDKVYTVLTVILIIWIGIVFHLLWLNRKVNTLEQNIQERMNAGSDKSPSDPPVKKTT